MAGGNEEEADRERLLGIRQGLRESITETYDQIEQAIAGDIADPETTLIEIDELLNMVTQFNERIADTTRQIDDVSALAQVREDMRTEAEQRRVIARRHSIVERWRRRVLKLSHAGSVASDDQFQDVRSQSNASLMRNFQSNVHLPELNLSTFDGNVLEWSAFWDIFESEVHNNRALANVSKFSYLLGQLKGQALAAVKGLRRTNENYEKALDILKERFGKTSVLVYARFRTLMSLQSPTERVSSLRIFCDTIEENVLELDSLGHKTADYGIPIVISLFDRLPANVRLQLQRTHKSDEWTLDEFREALKGELVILESQQGSSGKSHARSESSHKFKTDQPQSTVMSITNNKKQRVCPFCEKSEHKPVNCNVVQDIESRRKIASKKMLCFNCLMPGHSAKQCSSTFTCFHCSKRHHSSLHLSNDTKAEQSRQGTSNAAQVNLVASSPNTIQLNVAQAENALLMTAVTTLRGQASPCLANTLFDTGGQRSFVTRRLNERLRAKFLRNETIGVSSFGGNSVVEPTNVVQFLLLLNDGTSLRMEAVVVEQLTAPLHQTADLARAQRLPYLAGLRFAHPVFGDEPFEIDLLIGADYYWQIVGDKVVRGSGPTAIESRVGYLLSGKIRGPPAHVTHVFSLVTSSVSDAREETCNTPGETDEFLTYQSESVRKVGNHYVARLPFKEGHPPLASNKTIALGRTNSLLRRLRGNPVQLKLYHESILKQLEQNFIEEASAPTGGREHYLSHHPVFKDSTTTPLRIVYDCSCKGFNGVSLNDCLSSGPSLQNSMITIILRSRLTEYLFVTDISKAFHRIELHEGDRDFVRFFWPQDPFDENARMMTYRFRVVLFGATSAPFILNAVFKTHVRGFSSETSRDLEDNTYVDNIFLGRDTASEIVQSYRESIEILNDGGFECPLFFTNCSELETMLKCDRRLGTERQVKLLAVNWHREQDTIRLPEIKIKANSEEPVTKRNIQKTIAAAYDLIGFTTPISIRAWILIQTLWERGFDWDESVDGDLAREWHLIITDLVRFNQFETPRKYFPSRQPPTELHVFVDASKRAYGTVIFLSNGIDTSFVYSKAKVAPIVQRTMPELELLAAELGIVTADLILPAFSKQNLKVFAWSDSQVVLCWILIEKKRTVLVNNRATKIRRVNEKLKATWGYVPTDQNPADLLTRGVSFDYLISSSLWQRGPGWLCEPTAWPDWKPNNTEAITSVHIAKCLVSDSSENSIHTIIDIVRYNSLHKLVRVTAYVLRFCRNIRPKASKRVREPLSRAELDEALHIWIIAEQKHHYSDAYEYLSERKGKRPTIVSQLDLFLNNDVMRCGGRLRNAAIPEESRNPILLPRKGHFTELIILDCHDRCLHGGVNSTTSELRRQFWVPSARQTIRNLLFRCVICKRVQGRAFTAPPHAQLPKFRTGNFKPFEITGVDLTGAFYVKMNRKTVVKMYAVLFTCANSRASHIELVESLSAEAFLCALKRFVNGRTCPVEIWSDNATNFELSSKVTRLWLERAQEYCNTKGIRWRFIIKRAPWFGGFWERLIGLLKSTLKKVLGKSLVDAETLRTVLTDVEACLNDRPLTYASASINDPIPISPSDILYGRKIRSLPFSLSDSENDDSIFEPNNAENLNSLLMKRFKLSNDFQKRWKREYLTNLREFHKQVTGKFENKIRVGDVVLIGDDSKPRVQWKLGLVTNLLYGTDKAVRAVDLKTANGYTNRPVAKLYPLEVNHSPNEENKNEVTPVTTTNTTRRPVRQAAMAAKQRTKLLSEQGLI